MAVLLCDDITSLIEKESPKNILLLGGDGISANDNNYYNVCNTHVYIMYRFDIVLIGFLRQNRHRRRRLVMASSSCLLC